MRNSVSRPVRAGTNTPGPFGKIPPAGNHGGAPRGPAAAARSPYGPKGVLGWILSRLLRFSSGNDAPGVQLLGEGKWHEILGFTPA